MSLLLDVRQRQGTESHPQPDTGLFYYCVSATSFLPTSHIELLTVLKEAKLYKFNPQHWSSVSGSGLVTISP